MLHLFALLLAVAPPPPPPSLPPGTLTGHDPRQGPMSVSDKYLLPGRLPECADAYESQRAAEEEIKGFQPECLRPLWMERKRGS